MRRCDLGSAEYPMLAQARKPMEHWGNEDRANVSLGTT